MSGRFVQKKKKKNEKKSLFPLLSRSSFHTRRNAEQNDLVDRESVIIYVDGRYHGDLLCHCIDLIESRSANICEEEVRKFADAAQSIVRDLETESENDE